MGWSASVKACHTLDLIEDALRKGGYYTNGVWSYGGKEYFYELGREREDGGIRGSIYQLLPGGTYCVRRGTFAIAPDGRILRFPYLPPEVRKAVKEAICYQRGGVLWNR